MAQQTLVGPDYAREWENAKNVASAVRKYNLPLSMLTTKPIGHGGVERLMDLELSKVRLAAVFECFPELLSQRNSGDVNVLEVDILAETLSTQVTTNFRYLVESTPCAIPPELKLHIARNRPPVGTTFTSAEEEMNSAGLRSPDLPAAFTFVGQFIDHDLTMNTVDLVMEQLDSVENFASPRIDLDSVYGPREKLGRHEEAVFDNDMRFKFKEIAPGMFDLPRFPMDIDAETQNVAAIFDARNDENKMILQVHMLVQRLHNSFIEQGLPYAEARRRTILNWQSVILHDYLPRMIDSETLSMLRGWIDSDQFDDIKVAECDANGMRTVRIPHEFSIGFRMGHSQLRSSYKVNRGEPVPLFDSTLTANPGEDPPAYNDLRGGQTLVAGHQIDWEFFLGDDGPNANAIDTKVTQAVFDLPTRAIPDNIKYVTNLPMRNLVRSENLGICSGEALARFYAIEPLKPEVVEPDAHARAYFTTGGDFETPLWYYLLREADVTRSQQKSGPRNPLGKLGSRLIGEVICCAIKFNDINWWSEKQNADWSISGRPDVTLLDVVRHLKL